MIVRIQGDGQYRLDDQAQADLAQLDDHLTAAADAGQAQEAHDVLVKAITLVHTRGVVLDEDDLSPSELILPPLDASLDETRALLHAH